MTVVIGYSAAISLRNALSCQYMNSEQHSDVVVLSYNDAQLRKGLCIQFPQGQLKQAN